MFCRTLLNERSTRNWPELLNNYLGIDEISAQPILEYFQPLEEYFEKAPQTQSSYSTTQRTKITTPTTTPKPKPEHKKSKSDRKLPNNVTEPTTPIPAVNQTKEDEVYKNVKDSVDKNGSDSVDNGRESTQIHKAVILTAIGVLVCVTILAVSVALRKRFRRKRKANNRRFET